MPKIMKARRFLVLALGAALTSTAAAAAQTSLTGRTVTQLLVGDYVLPRFSPSGQLLAISQVLADTAGENTQILIFNFRRRVLDTLLAALAAAKYATYKAYVSDFEWLSDTSLVAWIPDGDVGVTGGLGTGRDIVFAAGSDTLTLYRWRRGRHEPLMRVPVRPQASSLAVRAQRRDSVWFVLRLHAPYERGNNPAFVYDGERLLPLADYAELADFDVHLPTRRIAFAYWDGQQRHVAVQELFT